MAPQLPPRRWVSLGPAPSWQRRGRGGDIDLGMGPLLLRRDLWPQQREAGEDDIDSRFGEFDAVPAAARSEEDGAVWWWLWLLSREVGTGSFDLRPWLSNKVS